MKIDRYPRASAGRRITRKQAQIQSPSVFALVVASLVVALTVAPIFAFAGEPDPSPSSSASSDAPAGLPVIESAPPSASQGNEPIETSPPTPEEPAPTPTSPGSSSSPGQRHSAEAQLRAALRLAAQLQADLPDPTIEVGKLAELGLETPTGVMVAVLSVARGDHYCMRAHHEDLPRVFYYIDESSDEASTEPCI